MSPPRPTRSAWIALFFVWLMLPLTHPAAAMMLDAATSGHPTRTFVGGAALDVLAAALALVLSLYVSARTLLVASLGTIALAPLMFRFAPAPALAYLLFVGAAPLVYCATVGVVVEVVSLPKRPTFTLALLSAAFVSPKAFAIVFAVTGFDVLLVAASALVLAIWIVRAVPRPRLVESNVELGAGYRDLRVDRPRGDVSLALASRVGVGALLLALLLALLNDATAMPPHLRTFVGPWIAEGAAIGGAWSLVDRSPMRWPKPGLFVPLVLLFGYSLVLRMGDDELGLVSGIVVTLLVMLPSKLVVAVVPYALGRERSAMPVAAALSLAAALGHLVTRSGGTALERHAISAVALFAFLALVPAWMFAYGFRAGVFGSRSTPSP